MAERIPMMAMTTSSSTNVNPVFLHVFGFILVLTLLKVVPHAPNDEKELSHAGLVTPTTKADRQAQPGVGSGEINHTCSRSIALMMTDTDDLR